MYTTPHINNTRYQTLNYWINRRVCPKTMWQQLPDNRINQVVTKLGLWTTNHCFSNWIRTLHTFRIHPSSGYLLLCIPCINTNHKQMFRVEDIDEEEGSECSRFYIMSEGISWQRLQCFDDDAHVWPVISFILYAQRSNCSHLYGWPKVVSYGIPEFSYFLCRKLKNCH